MLDLLVDDYINNMILGYENNLRIILTDEGVEVTEDNDMNSLIVKVDEEFDRKNEEIAAKEEELANSGGLDIISATELPATGKENQICVITQNPVDKFVLSSNFNDITSDNSQITLYLGNLVSTDTSLGTLVQSVNGSVTTNYYIYKVCQNTDRLASYIYQNSQWNALTVASVFALENGVELNTSIFGHMNTHYTFCKYSADLGYAIKIADTIDPYIYSSYDTKVNFSLFSKVKIKARFEAQSGTARIAFSAGTKSDVGSMGDKSNSEMYLGSVYSSDLFDISPSMSNTTTEFTFDVSGGNGEYYPGVIVAMNTTSGTVYITDIEFI